MTDARGVDYWRSARAVRERAEEMFEEAARGKLAHFDLHMHALPALAERVVEIARAEYPDLRDVPVHGRYRHFDARRLAALESRLASLPPLERLAARADLVVTSVLLDAGAGSAWRYVDASNGRAVGRSEGLGLASFDWFVSGGLASSTSSATPSALAADASRLSAVDATALGAAFQVTPTNPLVGLEGRASLLSRLAGAVIAKPSHFGVERPRPGNLAVFLARQAAFGELPADAILAAVLDALGPIWPGREEMNGVPLGDVWTHSRLGRFPFHKLSQWLSYSLFEPLEQFGIKITRQDALTGLAEYRNGGLFVDGEVLVPKHPGVKSDVHAVDSDVVIEWRALTVALIDRIADEIRAITSLDAARLPLAKILEAGTWRTGRVLANEKRADGSPPIRIDSDGTVF